MGRIVERKAASRVREALSDTRVVLINGARQSGKSTLAAQVARERGAAWFSLDRTAERQAAQRDPSGFVRAANPMVIDEVQRVPDLLLAVKEVVDSGYEPGRFLLTGSARLLGLKALPDSLPGRMVTVELWPLSQGEIDGAPDGFTAAAFRQGPDVRVEADLTRADYAARLVRGGFPGAVARAGHRRAAFLEAYVADIVNRDVVQVSEIERGPELRDLITMLAGRSGQLLDAAKLGGRLGLSRQTVMRYLALLEEVFLIKRLPAWGRSVTTRAVRARKLAFVDSGVAAAILGYDEDALLRITSPLGGLLEAFAAMELARQAAWASDGIGVYHYRTRDQVEVDVVLQDRRHRVVGIEVKASSTAMDADFRGLRHLQRVAGPDFVAGFVLYLGERTLPFGDKFRAVPLSALWQTPAPSSPQPPPQH
jgi:predicted AAA+ superfamily ATPase